MFSTGCVLCFIKTNLSCAILEHNNKTKLILLILGLLFLLALMYLVVELLECVYVLCAILADQSVGADLNSN